MRDEPHDDPENAGEVRRPVGRPCRACPDDFAERWPMFGWELAGEEWGCNNRSIRRWVEECGRSEMVLARKRYVEAERAVTSRARRVNYMMGRTLSHVGRKGGTGKGASPKPLADNEDSP